MTSGQKCDKMDEPGHQISWSGGDKPRGATDKLPRAFKPPALALFWHLMVVMGVAVCDGSQKLQLMVEREYCRESNFESGWWHSVETMICLFSWSEIACVRICHPAEES